MIDRSSNYVHVCLCVCVCASVCVCLVSTSLKNNAMHCIDLYFLSSAFPSCAVYFNFFESIFFICEKHQKSF